MEEAAEAVILKLAFKSQAGISMIQQRCRNPLDFCAALFLQQLSD